MSKFLSYGSTRCYSGLQEGPAIQRTTSATTMGSEAVVDRGIAVRHATVATTAVSTALASSSAAGAI